VDDAAARAASDSRESGERQKAMETRTGRTCRTGLTGPEWGQPVDYGSTRIIWHRPPQPSPFSPPASLRSRNITHRHHRHPQPPTLFFQSDGYAVAPNVGPPRAPGHPPCRHPPPAPEQLMISEILPFQNPAPRKTIKNPLPGLRRILYKACALFIGLSPASTDDDSFREFERAHGSFSRALEHLGLASHVVPTLCK
jgi:hypothetical protein